jgi:hypothetical protein|nr:MAG TPA: hypothetical protein [Caudoviricetes sp.]
MKNLLEVMNNNLGTNFRTVAEYGANADKIDMTIVAQTLYQYMLYQESIDKVDMNNFKVQLQIKKDK